ncbi:DUF1127 domain-containing protein [Bradyrhizobium sp. 930_D9_N1_4]|uniref:DUF1127 domain-containing protein n=1 Tax=Bradyrhizobium sp. 930_D9_N1_4 TaxID=3240374 RepID=UPI003F8A6D17
MLEQQLPSNVNPMVRPSFARIAGIARGLDSSTDRGGTRAPAAFPERPAYTVLPVTDMDQPATGWWWTALAFFTEGFALYGASMYPNAVFSLDEASLPANAHQASLADSRQPAMAHGQRGARSLDGSNVIAPGLAAWTGQPARDGGDWLAGFGEKVGAFWTHWRREQEIRKAVRALAEYDDRTLRDLGIQGRADIERMVRYCRDC